jgi:hypothetical protein
MAKLEDVIARFKSKPADFTWGELEWMLKKLEFKRLERNGSRVLFYRDNPKIKLLLHKPHPEPVMDKGAIADTIDRLTSKGLI